MRPRRGSRVLATVLGVAGLVLTLAAGPGVAVPSDTGPLQRALPAHPTPGAGWFLAVVDRGTDGEYGIDARSQRLVLVSPTGERTTVLTRRLRGAYDGVSLQDWSADGRTALLLQRGRSADRVIRVDVTTGTSQLLDLGRSSDGVVLDPDGSGVVATVFTEDGRSPFELRKVSWAGTVTTLPATTIGSLLVGPGHAVMTMGTTGGLRMLRVISLDDGSTLRTFRPGAFCTPVRWWDGSRVVARCGSNLSLVDWSTGERTALTSQRGRSTAHLDARRIDTGLYAEVAGACGTTYLARQARNGTMTKVPVPGSEGNVALVGGEGRRLVIAHVSSCDGTRPRAVLSRFDPRSGRERPIVELGRHEAFGRILVQGEVRATGW